MQAIAAPNANTVKICLAARTGLRDQTGLRRLNSNLEWEEKL